MCGGAEGQHWASRSCGVTLVTSGEPSEFSRLLNLSKDQSQAGTSFSRLRAGDGQVHVETNVTPTPAPSPQRGQLLVGK